jgi:uncharacterized tellurite resistance protein B-like protein
MLKKIGQLFVAKKAPAAEREFGELQLARAVLLLEMVHADFSEEPLEEDFVFHSLQHSLDISSDQARQLIELAHRERENSLDLHQFTSRINEGCSREEKKALLETFWRLAYVDGKVDKYEEALMRRLTKLFRLSHRQMIEAKLKVREELGLRHKDNPVRSRL